MTATQHEPLLKRRPLVKGRTLLKGFLVQLHLTDRCVCGGKVVWEACIGLGCRCLGCRFVEVACMHVLPAAFFSFKSAKVPLVKGSALGQRDSPC